ncbi:MAG: hypothetical protein NTX76_04085 [Alphaproteobacteria bacterium]|nr:hypothetical protein [Alphaproteobacteria bacterium]
MTLSHDSHTELCQALADFTKCLAQETAALKIFDFDAVNKIIPLKQNFALQYDKAAKEYSDENKLANRELINHLVTILRDTMTDNHMALKNAKRFNNRMVQILIQSEDPSPHAYSLKGVQRKGKLFTNAISINRTL